MSSDKSIIKENEAMKLNSYHLSRVMGALILLFLLSSAPLFSQDTPKFCRFWSNDNESIYKDNYITSSDKIEAYDPRGQKCGEL